METSEVKRRLFLVPPAPRPLTERQAQRRALVAVRSALIQAGVKPPASGVFGKPAKGKAA